MIHCTLLKEFQLRVGTSEVFRGC